MTNPAYLSQTNVDLPSEAKQMIRNLEYPYACLIDYQLVQKVIMNISERHLVTSENIYIGLDVLSGGNSKGP